MGRKLCERPPKPESEPRVAIATTTGNDIQDWAIGCKMAAIRPCDRTPQLKKLFAELTPFGSIHDAGGAVNAGSLDAWGPKLHPIDMIGLIGDVAQCISRGEDSGLCKRTCLYNLCVPSGCKIGVVHSSPTRH